MVDKELFAAISSILALVGYLPYFWAIFKKHTKPHMFSWIIWALLPAIAIFAGNSEGAGVGNWVLVVGVICSSFIALLSLFYGEKEITRSDWICFLIGLCAVPVWIATDNPLWAVLIISAIDTLAYIPTFRKSWRKPYEENASHNYVAIAKYGFAIVALEAYTWVTVLYMAVICVTDLLLYVLLIFRRYQVSGQLTFKDFHH